MVKEGLVTVIVPVYNIKTYLPQCLACIKAQTYTNLEIILVDDGSTDGSEIICDEYATTDPRARVIHHPENRGLWAARNTGQEAATGEYLWFPDGDDYFHRDTVKTMYEAINCAGSGELDYDMAIVSYKMTSSMTEDTSFVFTPSIREVTVMDLFAQIVKPSHKMSAFAMWGKLFRRGLLEGVYSENYKYAQDRDVSIKVLLKEPRVVVVDNELYYWRQRPLSARYQSDYPFVRALCETRFTYKNYLSLNNQTQQYGCFLLESLYCRMADCFDTIERTNKGAKIKQELRNILKDTWKAYLVSSGTRSLPKRIKRIIRLRFNDLYKLMSKAYVARY